LRKTLFVELILLRVSRPLHLRTERNQVSETLCSFWNEVRWTNTGIPQS